MNNLREDQLHWARMLKNATPGGAKPVPTIDLVNVVEQEPLEFNSSDLLGCDIESDPIEIESDPIAMDTHTNSLGKCTVCHKTRRLWSGVCGWCGADPEDFEEE